MKTATFIDPWLGKGQPKNPTTEQLLGALQVLNPEMVVLAGDDLYRRYSVGNSPDKVIPGGSEGVETSGDTLDEAVLTTWQSLTMGSPKEPLTIYRPLKVRDRLPGGPGRYGGYFVCAWNPLTARFEQVEGEMDKEFNFITDPDTMWVEFRWPDA